VTTSVQSKPAATGGPWSCTTVIADGAGVYSEPSTSSRLVKSKAIGAGIRVIRTPDTAPGWYMVMMGTGGGDWMLSRDLAPLRPYSDCSSG
jgi:hypothetical protein